MTQHALHTLLEHAERQRDDAVATLLRTEQALQRLEQQRVQLLAYRDDYRERHPAQGGRSAPIEMLRMHQGFMGRLDQALQQHQGQVDAAQARAAAQRAALVALETRVASVRKLLERRGEQARLRADQQEQRRSDDAAQHRRRDANGLAGWRGLSEPMPLTH